MVLAPAPRLNAAPSLPPTPAPPLNRQLAPSRLTPQPAIVAIVITRRTMTNPNRTPVTTPTAACGALAGDGYEPVFEGGNAGGDVMLHHHAQVAIATLPL